MARAVAAHVRQSVLLRAIMAELAWQKPSLNGTAPSSRGGHTAVLADTQLVIFGGHRYGGDGVFEYFNDVHVLVRRT